MALRGDPPTASARATRRIPDGYANAAELVAGIAAHGDFDISVSAYPGEAPGEPDFATDIDMLKRKVDNGATRAITQFFFDNDLYERYRRARPRAGIYIPIVPGILPVHNFTQVPNFAARAGAMCRPGSPSASTGWRTTPQTRRWSPPPSRPSRCWTSSSAASPTSTSTR